MADGKRSATREGAISGHDAGRDGRVLTGVSCVKVTGQIIGVTLYGGGVMGMAGVAAAGGRPSVIKVKRQHFVPALKRRGQVQEAGRGRNGEKRPVCGGGAAHGDGRPIVAVYDEVIPLSGLRLA